MALNKCEMRVNGGPNDWDLWLCLRGTIPQVTFRFLPIKVPWRSGIVTAAAAVITQLRKSNGVRDVWYLESEVLTDDPKSRLTLRGTYNSDTRAGVFEAERTQLP